MFSSLSQAIQINTGGQQPTTLLLTTGLQQMRAKGNNNSPNLTQMRPTMAQVRPGVVQVRSTMTPMRPVAPTQPQGIRIKSSDNNSQSLMALINSGDKTHASTAPQILLSSKLNPLLTISRNVSPQTIGQLSGRVMGSQASGVKVADRMNNAIAKVFIF